MHTHTHTQSDDQEKVETIRKGTEVVPDEPVDLASLYASKGGVDLGTLSELTRSVRETAGVDTGDGSQLRSKRKCVIVREEISKLQEILGVANSVEPKSSSGGIRPRGRGRGRPVSSGRSSDVGYQEPTLSVRKYRRPAYSQFTHKRRKRRKRQPEEGVCWSYLQRISVVFKPSMLHTECLFCVEFALLLMYESSSIHSPTCSLVPRCGPGTRVHSPAVLYGDSNTAEIC